MTPSVPVKVMREQIVFGVEDIKVGERLLREAELTVEGAIKICQASDLSHKHVKTFNKMSAVVSPSVSDSAAAVGAVSHQRRRGAKTRPAQQSEVMFKLLVSNAPVARAKIILPNSASPDGKKGRKEEL